MTRDIKFRIWDTYSKYFIEGLSLTDGEFDDDADTLTFHLDKVMGDRDPDKKRFVYQQYTGLKDKNGVEIYVGDIIDKNQVVVWEDGMFVLEYEGRGGYYRECDPTDMTYGEVIGNVYQNPELLS